MEFVPTIGLEVHAELKTKTKMFCNSANDPEERRPNVNVCPICLGHPGTLPTINKEAVRQVLRVGLAVGGTLADDTEFERKNYFYPDLPKGYQISQYKHPLVTGGSLEGIALTRVHLEEDTGRLLHDQKIEASLVDFNRAGVPLMELVTEPVITSSKQAADFARELQLLLRYLEVAEANMEKGQMRVEANISMGRRRQQVAGGSLLGTKVEIKNLNSFRSVERALDYEIKRQQETLVRGEKVIQETRGWDEVQEITFSQREKESAHDYRYFPEPDLPPLKISEIAEFQGLQATIPELPWQKRERHRQVYGIRTQDTEVLINNLAMAKFFDAVAEELHGDREKIQLAANYLISDVGGLKDGDRFYATAAGHFVELINLISGGEISSRGAKDILAEITVSGKRPRQVAKERNLYQQSDEAKLQAIVEAVVAKNSKVVADYKAGKSAALQFLIGQGMKENRGAADPQVLERLLTNYLHRL